jgi:hypothetical protein
VRLRWLAEAEPEAAPDQPAVAFCSANAVEDIMEQFADVEITPHFWELIGASRCNEESMRSILMDLTREDLIRFEAVFQDAISDLVYRVIGDHGDAYDEEEIAGWVVSRGLPFYAMVWDHPERFPSELPDEGESFYGLAGVVFDERFPGRPVTTAEPYEIDYWPKVRASIVQEQGKAEQSAAHERPCDGRLSDC